MCIYMHETRTAEKFSARGNSTRNNTMSDESTRLTNLEHRAVIKFLTKNNKTPKDIFEEMSAVYGDSGPSYSTVKRWSQLFRQGRESIEDDPRTGRSPTAVTDENINKVKKIVLQDRRVKMQQIANALKISKERVGEILHAHLRMKKVSERWVSKKLTSDTVLKEKRGAKSSTIDTVIQT